MSKAKDFDEAIEIANNTEYGLTGAVITNNRMNIEKAREDFHVGNLILQPWMYWCNCWIPTIWWIQYVRYRFKSWRTRLHPTSYASKNNI